MEVVPAQSLSAPDTALLLAARAIAQSTYSPYSHFGVGAAVRTRSGAIYQGCNVENASFIAAHAELTACTAAAGAGDTEIIDLAVAASTIQPESTKLLIPCGHCRQTIFEFANLHANDIRILCDSFNRTHIGITSITTLLPYPFGPDDVFSAAQRNS